MSADLHENPVATVRTVAGGLLVALCVAACSDQKMSWYDESKGYEQERKERINRLIGQGMTETQAEREVDFESAIKNTERGPETPPMEGVELENAIRAGTPGQKQ